MQGSGWQGTSTGAIYRLGREGGGENLEKSCWVRGDGAPMGARGAAAGRCWRAGGSGGGTSFGVGAGGDAGWAAGCGISQRLNVHRFSVVVVVVVVIYFAPSADLHRRTGPRGARGAAATPSGGWVPRRARGAAAGRSWLAGGSVGGRLVGSIPPFRLLGLGR